MAIIKNISRSDKQQHYYTSKSLLRRNRWICFGGGTRACCRSCLGRSLWYARRFAGRYVFVRTKAFWHMIDFAKQQLHSWSSIWQTEGQDILNNSFALWIIEQGWTWTFSITMLDFEISETVIENFCASSIVIGCYVLFPIMIWTNFLWRETHVWARGTSCIIWKSCRLKNAHLWIIELRSLWFESCSKLYDKWWAGCGTIWNNFINKFSPEKPLALITMLQVVKNTEFLNLKGRKLFAKVRKLLWSPWSIEKGLQLYRNVFLPFLLYLKH